MAKEKRSSPEDINEALPKIRQVCDALDDCKETLSYGNPAFKRGRTTFLVLDRYNGVSCLWLLIDPGLRDNQLAIDGWFASPYDPQRAAVCCELGKLDWSSLGVLILASYSLAGLRMRRP